MNRMRVRHPAHVFQHIVGCLKHCARLSKCAREVNSLWHSCAYDTLTWRTDIQHFLLSRARCFVALNKISVGNYTIFGSSIAIIVFTVMPYTMQSKHWRERWDANKRLATIENRSMYPIYIRYDIDVTSVCCSFVTVVNAVRCCCCSLLNAS